MTDALPCQCLRHSALFYEHTVIYFNQLLTTLLPFFAIGGSATIIVLVRTAPLLECKESRRMYYEFPSAVLAFPSCNFTHLWEKAKWNHPSHLFLLL